MYMYVHNILASDDSLDNEVKSLNPKLQFQLEYLIVDYYNSTHKSTCMYMYMYMYNVMYNNKNLIS